jgi:glutathione S-transferase
MSRLVLAGRSSSHFTRLARIFAIESGCDFEFELLEDLASTNAENYSGNPSLTIPALLVDREPVLGSVNICRRFAELSGQRERYSLPEDFIGSQLLQNAHELVMTGMSAQVTIVFSTLFANIAKENGLVMKSQQRLNGLLAWLNTNWQEILAQIPQEKLSTIEAGLFCLLEHIDFRRTEGITIGDELRKFVTNFGAKQSAKDTPFKMDFT